MRPSPGSNTESPEERPLGGTLKRGANKSTESVESARRLFEGGPIHPLNFSVSDLNSPKPLKRGRRKRDERQVSIPMRDLGKKTSPVRVHRREVSGDSDSSTLKRIHDTRRETKDDTLKRSDVLDLRFADENSDSSNDIKFADDSPDSNRLADRYEVMA